MSSKQKKARIVNSSIIARRLAGRDLLQSNRTKNRMRIAARIDELRVAKGWKKKELAEKLNKRPSEITKWLSGNHNFTVDILSDLEFVFGEPFFHFKDANQQIVFEVKVVLSNETAASFDLEKSSYSNEKVENQIKISHSEFSKTSTSRFYA